MLERPKGEQYEYLKQRAACSVLLPGSGIVCESESLLQAGSARRSLLVTSSRGSFVVAWRGYSGYECGQSGLWLRLAWK